MKKVWGEHKHDSKLMAFFPSRFLNSIPPKDYFFKVFAVIYPEKFSTMMTVNKIRLSKKIKAVKKISITVQAQQILSNYNADRLDIFLERKRKKKISVARLLANRKKKSMKLSTFYEKKKPGEKEKVIQEENQNEGH